MSYSGEPEAPTLVLRLSVPAGSEFRTVATDLAVKVAEYLGQSPAEAAAAGAIIEALAAEVGSADAGSPDIIFEFHQADDELRIAAQCAGRSSVATHPLPT